MKFRNFKLSSLLILTVALNPLFAQENKLRDVEGAMNQNDLETAKSKIDNIAQHSSTVNSVNMWAWKGIVYTAITLSEDQNIKNLEPNSLEIAVQAFGNFYSFPEESRSKYADEAKLYAPSALSLAYNHSAKLLQAKGSFSKIKELCGIAEKIYAANSQEESVITSGITADKINYLVWNSAYKDSLVNEEIVYLNKLIANPKYTSYVVYTRMAQIYTDRKDYDKALEYLNLGKERVPNEANSFFQQEINIEIDRNNYNSLLDKFTEGIKNDPENSIYYSNRAFVYSQLKDKEIEEQKNASKNGQTPAASKFFYIQSLNDFAKALELDPSNNDALINQAAVYIDSSNYAYKQNSSSPNTTATLKTALEKCKYIYDNGLISGEKVVELLKNMKSICGKLLDDEGRKKYDELYKKEKAKLNEN